MTVYWNDDPKVRPWWDGLAVVGVEQYEPVFDVVTSPEGVKYPRLLGYLWQRYSFEEIALMKKFAASLPTAPWKKERVA